MMCADWLYGVRINRSIISVLDNYMTYRYMRNEYFITNIEIIYI